MTTLESAATTIRAPGAEFKVDEAQLAAVASCCLTVTYRRLCALAYSRQRRVG
jgi:hypothetical protein